MKKRTVGIIISLVFMITTVSFAQGHSKRGSMLDKLNLTEKQQDSLSEIKTEQKKQMIAIRAKISLAKIEMGEILKDKDFSNSKVKSQVKEIMALKTSMEMSKFNSIDKIRNILTVEQWKTISSKGGKAIFRLCGDKGSRGKGRHHKRDFGDRM
ncbi:MAG: hypothetical protein GY714_14355 [Desulfobacterales bacterium]|nr:hypothetical protein [Desulfobacterales bacterium]MCP4159573.1 hypothetical protein [Deltaproteobacteria bacterium]